MSVIYISSEDEDDCLIEKTYKEGDLQQTHVVLIDVDQSEESETENDETLPELKCSSDTDIFWENRNKHNRIPFAEVDHLLDEESESDPNRNNRRDATSETSQPKEIRSAQKTQILPSHIWDDVTNSQTDAQLNIFSTDIRRNSTNINVSSQSGHLQREETESKIRCIAERLTNILTRRDSLQPTLEQNHKGTTLIEYLPNNDTTCVDEAQAKLSNYHAIPKILLTKRGSQCSSVTRIEQNQLNTCVQSGQQEDTVVERQGTTAYNAKLEHGSEKSSTNYNKKCGKPAPDRDSSIIAALTSTDETPNGSKTMIAFDNVAGLEPRNEDISNLKKKKRGRKVGWKKSKPLTGRELSTPAAHEKLNGSKTMTDFDNVAGLELRNKHMSNFKKKKRGRKLGWKKSNSLTGRDSSTRAAHKTLNGSKTMTDFGNVAGLELRNEDMSNLKKKKRGRKLGWKKSKPLAGRDSSTPAALTSVHETLNGSKTMTVPENGIGLELRNEIMPKPAKQKPGRKVGWRKSKRLTVRGLSAHTDLTGISNSKNPVKLKESTSNLVAAKTDDIHQQLSPETKDSDKHNECITKSPSEESTLGPNQNLQKSNKNTSSRTEFSMNFHSVPVSESNEFYSVEAGSSDLNIQSKHEDKTNSQDKTEALVASIIQDIRHKIYQETINCSLIKECNTLPHVNDERFNTEPDHNVLRLRKKTDLRKLNPGPDSGSMFNINVERASVSNTNEPLKHNDRAEDILAAVIKDQQVRQETTKCDHKNTFNTNPLSNNKDVDVGTNLNKGIMESVQKKKCNRKTTANVLNCNDRTHLPVQVVTRKQRENEAQSTTNSKLSSCALEYKNKEHNTSLSKESSINVSVTNDNPEYDNGHPNTQRDLHVKNKTVIQTQKSSPVFSEPYNNKLKLTIDKLSGRTDVSVTWPTQCKSPVKLKNNSSFTHSSIKETKTNNITCHNKALNARFKEPTSPTKQDMNSTGPEEHLINTVNCVSNTSYYRIPVHETLQKNVSNLSGPNKDIVCDVSTAWKDPSTKKDNCHLRVNPNEHSLISNDIEPSEDTFNEAQKTTINNLQPCIVGKSSENYVNIKQKAVASCKSSGDGLAARPSHQVSSQEQLKEGFGVNKKGISGFVPVILQRGTSIHAVNNHTLLRNSKNPNFLETRIIEQNKGNNTVPSSCGEKRKYPEFENHENGICYPGVDSEVHKMWKQQKLDPQTGTHLSVTLNPYSLPRVLPQDANYNRITYTHTNNQYTNYENQTYQQRERHHETVHPTCPSYDQSKMKNYSEIINSYNSPAPQYRPPNGYPYFWHYDQNTPPSCHVVPQSYSHLHNAPPFYDRYSQQPHFNLNPNLARYNPLNYQLQQNMQPSLVVNSVPEHVQHHTMPTLIPAGDAIPNRLTDYYARGENNVGVNLVELQSLQKPVQDIYNSTTLIPHANAGKTPNNDDQGQFAKTTSPDLLSSIYPANQAIGYQKPLLNQTLQPPRVECQTSFHEPYSLY